MRKIIFIVPTLVILIGGGLVAASPPKDALINADDEDILRSLEGYCFTLNAGWWSYEWCHRRHVKQFHVDLPSGKVDPMWSLGQYTHTDLERRSEDFDASSMTSVVDVFDAGGQHCDETGKGRETRVEFKCCTLKKTTHMPKLSALMSIHESEVCANTAVVCTPLVCGVGRAVQLSASIMKAAKDGDAHAQFELAVCYRNGFDIRQDEVEAVRWFMEAAKQGNSQSMWEVGEMFCSGGGVIQDKETGVEWKRKAAAVFGYKESVSCDFEFREIVGYEEIASHEEHVGFQLSNIMKAAKAGHPYSQFELAVCYRNGIGIRQDMKEAMHWFLKALKQRKKDGNQDHSYHHRTNNCLLEIGEMLCTGEGGNQDKEFGLLLIREAADEFGFVGPISCEEHFERPLEVAFAENMLAECYEQGHGFRHNESKSLFWFTKAAINGNRFSMWRIGRKLCDGEGVSQDKKKGIEWIRQAAIEFGYDGPVKCDFELNDFHEIPLRDHESVASSEGLKRTESPTKSKASKKKKAVKRPAIKWNTILIVFLLASICSVSYLLVRKNNNDESVRRAREDALKYLLKESSLVESSSAARNRARPKKLKRGPATVRSESMTQPNVCEDRSKRGLAAVRAESASQLDLRKDRFGASATPPKMGDDTGKKIDPSNHPSSKDCAFCLSHGAILCCKGCSKAYYCDPLCQKSHWDEGHKAVCLQVRAEYAQDLEDAATPSDRLGALPEFLCPISKDIMIDPVVAADNQTYDRASIEVWMAQATVVLSEARACLDRGCYDEATHSKCKAQLKTGVKSPTTGVALCHLDLEPNLELLEKICEYRSYSGSAFT